LILGVSGRLGEGYLVYICFSVEAIIDINV
jgi:hypothetical protein